MPQNRSCFPPSSRPGQLTLSRLVSETCPEIIIGVLQTRNPLYFGPQCHNVDRHRVIVNLLIVLFPIALQSMNLDMKEPPTICRYVSSEELFFHIYFSFTGGQPDKNTSRDHPFWDCWVSGHITKLFQEVLAFLCRQATWDECFHGHPALRILAMRIYIYISLYVTINVLTTIPQSGYIIHLFTWCTWDEDVHVMYACMIHVYLYLYVYMYMYRYRYRYRYRYVCVCASSSYLCPYYVFVSVSVLQAVQWFCCVHMRMLIYLIMQSMGDQAR